jgi:hypothetical protein
MERNNPVIHWSDEGRGSGVFAQDPPYGDVVLSRLALAVLVILALFAVVAVFRIVRDEISRRR